MMDTVKRAITQLLQQFAYLPQTFQLIWAASRLWTVSWLILLVIQGALPTATVTLTRWFVDSLVQVVGKGISWQSFQPIMLPGVLMLMILVLSEVLSGMSEWVRTAQAELVQDHISALVHKQSSLIDYGCYESPEYYDRLSRAQEEAGARPLALLESTGTLLQNSVTLASLAVVLLPYGLTIPVLLIISAIPAFYVALKHNLRQYRWSQKTTTERRMLNYYRVLLTERWPAAELRLFQYGDYFQTAYQQVRERLRLQQLRLIRAQSLGRLMAGFFTLLVGGAALLLVGRQVLLGVLSLGDVALFYQAFSRGQIGIKAALNSLTQLYKNSLFIGNLFEFLSLTPDITDPVHPQPIPNILTQGIQLKQVVFRYPGSPEPTLNRFDLFIPAAKVTAIVGDNGAGKSTLLKLLCRFYDPESGSVLLDGVDIRQFSVLALRRLITILFQDHVPYFVTASENIALSDLAAPRSQSEIETAAKAAGIHDKLDSLTDGYNSMLGKLMPGGTDLSGGQWQRLSLARAFYRQAPIIILDEPTSAMDPWAEQDWLLRFRQMAAGKTSIVITHRFTLAMQADLIHVMRGGQIVESGSHTKLLELNGLYAQSWRSQMQAPTSSSLEPEPAPVA
jgi:ATP-binding cassette, subfamily B, bacterial